MHSLAVIHALVVWGEKKITPVTLLMGCNDVIISVCHPGMRKILELPSRGVASAGRTYMSPRRYLEGAGSSFVPGKRSGHECV